MYMYYVLPNKLNSDNSEFNCYGCRSLCLSHLNLISSQPDLSVNFYQRVLSD